MQPELHGSTVVVALGTNVQSSSASSRVRIEICLCASGCDSAFSFFRSFVSQPTSRARTRFSFSPAHRTLVILPGSPEFLLESPRRTLAVALSETARSRLTAGEAFSQPAHAAETRAGQFPSDRGREALCASAHTVSLLLAISLLPLQPESHNDEQR